MVLALFCACFVTRAHAETETLQQTWVTAYQSNPSLLSERASLRALDEQVSQALSHWRPSVDATSSIGKNYQYIPAQKPQGTADFADTSRSYGVQVTQPVFRGFRTEAETESAEKQVLAGRAHLLDAEQQVLLDTATAFLDIIRDQDVLARQIENEKVLEKKLKETSVRAKFGELTETDVHQAEARLARANVSRFQAKDSLTQDREAYQRLVGKAPEKLMPPKLDEKISGTMDEILHRALNRNPKIVQANYTLDAADAEITLNKGSLLPEINLVGSRTSSWGQSSAIPGQQGFRPDHAAGVGAFVPFRL